MTIPTDTTSALPQCPQHPEFYIAVGGQCPVCGWPVAGSNNEPPGITRRDLMDAIDDLWSCIGGNDIATLQDRTIEVAQAVHTRLWPHHRAEEVAQSESQ